MGYIRDGFYRYKSNFNMGNRHPLNEAKRLELRSDFIKYTEKIFSETEQYLNMLSHYDWREYSSNPDSVYYLEDKEQRMKLNREKREHLKDITNQYLAGLTTDTNIFSLLVNQWAINGWYLNPDKVNKEIFLSVFMEFKQSVVEAAGSVPDPTRGMNLQNIVVSVKNKVVEAWQEYNVSLSHLFGDFLISEEEFWGHSSIAGPKQDAYFEDKEAHKNIIRIGYRLDEAPEEEDEIEFGANLDYALFFVERIDRRSKKTNNEIERNGMSYQVNDWGVISAINARTQQEMSFLYIYSENVSKPGYFLFNGMQAKRARDNVNNAIATIQQNYDGVSYKYDIDSLSELKLILEEAIPDLRLS